MMRPATRPDVPKVMRELKDFQRATVERLFQRMYVDGDCTQRFLLADEVGLGKTLVCKGLIAKAIDHLWLEKERIDVLYVCSNSDIARQNIRRLSSAQTDFSHASRITLLPITLRDLAKSKVNFISITPGTSLDLKSSLGTAEERALLHALLVSTWDLDPMALADVLRGNTKRPRFRQRVKEFPAGDIDTDLARRFSEALRDAVARAEGEGKPSLRKRMERLQAPFDGPSRNVPAEAWNDRSLLVGELRGLLAQTCLAALDPDLVILDEFQRFKHLLDGEDPASELAQQIFTFKDVRVLLVSATPYKMYTVEEEAGGEDHHRDFIQTLRFLSGEEDARAVESRLGEYRREMFSLAVGGGSGLEAVKNDLEQRLRRVMVRTERLAATPDRSGMLEQVASAHLPLRTEDLLAYLGLQEVSELVGQRDTIEYWKSAPYLLNFMDGYDLKQALERAEGQPGRAADVARALARTRGLLLPADEVRRYGEVDPGNGRLRHLSQDTLDRGVWRCLWLPPAMPYVQPGAPFDAPRLDGFSKRLVFSSWRVVPKTVACLLSYEAERRAMQSQDRDAENTPEARERRRPLLRVARAQGRLTGMPLMGLLYPSAVLAREADPLALRRAQERLPTVEEAIAATQSRLAPLIEALTSGSPTEGAVDESWYWALPVMLDMADPKERRHTLRWLRGDHLDSPPGGEEEGAEDRDEGEAGDDGDSVWAAHVRMLRRAARGRLRLGRAPADLHDVMATLGLGGFGATTYRMLRRQIGPKAARDSQTAVDLRSAALDVAWSIRRLFNLPEATAIVRGLDGREPFWLRAAEYAVRGNLAAVLDEYGHVLREQRGIRGSAERILKEFPEALRDVLGLRTSLVTVEEIQVDEARGRFKLEPQRMRARFACRLGVDDAAEGGAEPTRQDQVRAAFNSPFWPFVLATTSIGQEGLDFHPYCHAVVHWNLPSNPVDLEQREGRVHRFKGHAVRKNLAARYGIGAVARTDKDPWRQMFAAAEAARPSGANDLEPYWLLPGAARIERHVPAFALSRDHQLLDALRRSLVLYRMAFGQPRQQELIEYLRQHVPKERVDALLATLNIDLSPTARGMATTCAGAPLADGRAPTAEAVQ